MGISRYSAVINMKKNFLKIAVYEYLGKQIAKNKKSVGIGAGLSLLAKDSNHLINSIPLVGKVNVGIVRGVANNKDFSEKSVTAERLKKIKDRFPDNKKQNIPSL